MKNEKGFILPLTAMFTTLLLFWVMHNSTIYFSQQSFYNELKKSYYLDNLHTLAILEVKSRLNNEEIDPIIFIDTYPRGTIEVKMTDLNQSDILVDIICKLSDKYVRKSFYTFNKNSEKLYPRE